jgi:hypothetical protein
MAERAVLACFDVAAIGQVPRGRRFGPTPPPAAVAPWLLAGGGEVDAALAARVLGPALAALEDEELVDIRDGVARANVAILPAGGHGALAVSDRFDADADDAVLPPDDSSHHLVSAMPPHRVGRWLDLGTGNAWAPLACAGRAETAIAADVNPRAIAHARRGAAMSGLALDLRLADLARGIDGPFDLVTFNAPIPRARGETGPRHRVGDDELLDRFWAVARSLVAPDGEAIVHSVVGEPPDLPGAVIIARYTPPGVPAFAITCWRPGGVPGVRFVEIALTATSPHVPRDALEE